MKNVQVNHLRELSSLKTCVENIKHDNSILLHDFSQFAIEVAAKILCAKIYPKPATIIHDSQLMGITISQLQS